MHGAKTLNYIYISSQVKSIHSKYAACAVTRTCVQQITNLVPTPTQAHKTTVVEFVLNGENVLNTIW